MEASPYIAVGRIVKSHGMAGEISVAESTTLPLEELIDHEVWVVPPVRVAIPHRVLNVRTGPKGPLMVLEGVDDIAYAREMAGCSICVARGEFPPGLLEGPASHVGYSVSDVERGSLGTIEDLIVTGANDVWIVRGPLGEVLIPVIDDVVLEIDDESAAVSVKLLPGLLEDDR